MKQLTVAEARENFERCLAEVEGGEEIVLMRDGRPVARIAPERIPPLSPRRLTPAQEAAQAELMKLLRKGIDIGIGKFDRDALYDRD